MRRVDRIAVGAAALLVGVAYLSGGPLDKQHTSVSETLTSDLGEVIETKLDSTLRVSGRHGASKAGGRLLHQVYRFLWQSDEPHGITANDAVELVMNHIQDQANNGRLVLHGGGSSGAERSAEVSSKFDRNLQAIITVIANCDDTSVSCHIVYVEL